MHGTSPLVWQTVPKHFMKLAYIRCSEQAGLLTSSWKSVEAHATVNAAARHNSAAATRAMSKGSAFGRPLTMQFDNGGPAAEHVNPVHLPVPNPCISKQRYAQQYCSTVAGCSPCCSGSWPAVQNELTSLFAFRMLMGETCCSGLRYTTCTIWIHTPYSCKVETVNAMTRLHQIFDMLQYKANTDHLKNDLTKCNASTPHQGHAMLRHAEFQYGTSKRCLHTCFLLSRPNQPPRAHREIHCAQGPTATDSVAGGAVSESINPSGDAADGALGPNEPQM
jgi:hypothetical protein